LFKITILKKSKEITKPGGKDAKANKEVQKNKEYSFDIKKGEEIFNQLIYWGKLSLLTITSSLLLQD